MKITVSKPKELTTKELNQVKELIILGGQVSKNNLESRILNCELIGRCFADDKLIGVSAIKRPLKSYIDKILNKAKIHKDKNPSFELGYSVTLKDFRGKGVNRKINDELLDNSKGISIFATTDNSSMRKYLVSKGFVKVGESYKGKFNETIDYYEL